MEERIQKILSEYGICSRRNAELLISNRRVKVNGIYPQIGDKADPEKDTITVDEVPIDTKPGKEYWVLNKPRGFIVSKNDEKNRPTVMSFFPETLQHLYPVGRLDYNSEGVLLFTNDGELCTALTHPKQEVQKIYIVWVLGEAKEALEKLNRPMKIDGQQLKAATVRLLKENETSRVLQFIIHEGKNRQIRKRCERVGLEVKRLKRVDFGGIELGKLKAGEIRRLSKKEVQGLKNMCNL